MGVSLCTNSHTRCKALQGFLLEILLFRKCFSLGGTAASYLPQHQVQRIKAPMHPQPGSCSPTGLKELYAVGDSTLQSEVFYLLFKS